MTTSKNVWSAIKKEQQEQKKRQENSIWANIGDMVTEEEPINIPKPYIPVIVDNKLPEGSISLDIETGSVTEMWRTGPEFLRLFGYCVDNGPVETSESKEYLLHDIMSRDGWIIGHNIMNFDSLLLDKHHGVSILKLAKEERLRDTKLIAFLADPPYSRTKEGEIEKLYSLQTVGTKYLGEGKMLDVATGSSILKILANRHGGFDKIPVDDPEYNEYLKRDVEVTRDLVKVLPINDYVLREHKIAAIAATISIQGFRVDLDLLDQRIKEGEEKRDRILTQLESYGLPGKETTKSPHRTNKGLEAIEKAFSDLGINLERTATGRPAMSKPVLESMLEKESNNKEACDLAEAIMGLNGIRTCYQNIKDNLVGDKVHPSINLRQSTGRWSCQNPSVTTIGKRGGKVTERAVYLPDNEDHVLISADLAQVDARAVAALSQDTEYLKLFEEGRDLHAEMALRLFGTVNERERAKAVVHSINYGARAKKVSLMTGMSVYEAENVISNFEKSFPRLARWQSEIREIGETTGILWNGYGRMLRIESDRAFTQSPALIAQSSARDILMQGLLNLFETTGESTIRMIKACIHDEILISCPIKDAEEVENLVIKAMSFPWCPKSGQYPVQIVAGLNKRGKNWADSYRKD